MAAIPKPVRVNSRKTIQECRKSYCEHCGGKATGEPHHIRPRSLGGSDIPENLIQLCFDCHRATHDGKILYTKFIPVVAKREGLTVEEVYTCIGWPIPDDEEIETAAVPPSLATYSLDELLQMYITVQESENANKWLKGAVCLVLTEGMGISARQTGSWLGCSAANVRQLAKTFKAFPDESKRVSSLYWRHHYIAANTDEPELWISLAADNEWSTRQMEEQINIEKGKINKKDAEMEKAERAYRLAKEVFAEAGEPAEWLHKKLEELLEEKEEFEKEPELKLVSQN